MIDHMHPAKVVCMPDGSVIGYTDAAYTELCRKVRRSHNPPTLFAALVELFPQYTKSELRRLLESGAVRGCLVPPISLPDALQYPINETSARVDADLVQIGKKLTIGLITYPPRNMRLEWQQAGTN